MTDHSEGLLANNISVTDSIQVWDYSGELDCGILEDRQQERDDLVAITADGELRCFESNALDSSARIRHLHSAVVAVLVGLFLY